MVGDVKQSIYDSDLQDRNFLWRNTTAILLKTAKEQRMDLAQKFPKPEQKFLSSVNYIFRQIMGEDLGGITYDDDNALYPGASFPEKEHTAGEKTNDSENTTEVASGRKRRRRTVRRRKWKSDGTGAGSTGHCTANPKMVGNEEDAGQRERQIPEGWIRRYRDPCFVQATGWAEPFSQVLSIQRYSGLQASRTGYFSAQEVVTLLNYLRVCDNPLQDIPLTGVLHSPIVGCTVQELAILKSRCPDGMLYDSLCAILRTGTGGMTEEEKCLRKNYALFRLSLKRCGIWRRIHRYMS